MVFFKVLFLFLFYSHYTPLHSALSIISTVNHHLHADDTQLFISFSAPNFSKNLLLLQDTISKVSTWMSSNILSLNHSKTEVIGPLSLSCRSVSSTVCVCCRIVRSSLQICRVSILHRTCRIVNKLVAKSMKNKNETLPTKHY